LENQPTLRISNLAAAVESVTGADGLLECMGTLGGLLCIMEGEPGAESTVTVCYSDGDCVTTTFTVPVCPTDYTNPLSFATYCSQNGTPMLLIEGPVITVESVIGDVVAREGIDIPLDVVVVESLTDDDLPIASDIEGIESGERGEEITLTICYSDDSCQTVTFRVPTCPKDMWNLADVGCHNEESLYAIIDTNIDGVVPGSGYTYDLNVGTFACSENPDHPGRVYCSFPFSEAPFPLQFCVTPPSGGADEVCEDFDDFKNLLPASCGDVPLEDDPSDKPGVLGEDKREDLGEDDPDDKPEDLGDDDPGDEPEDLGDEEETPCSEYGDPGSCTSNGCVWKKGPPDGQEHCYDP